MPWPVRRCRLVRSPRAARALGIDWYGVIKEKKRKHSGAVEADLQAALREGQTISLNDVLAHASRKKELLPAVAIRLTGEGIAIARQLAHERGELNEPQPSRASSSNSSMTRISSRAQKATTLAS
jgi:hypothetical protein